MEWKIEVTLPVVREMTMVADVKRPEITAREEASTVIEGPVEGGVNVASGGDGAGVGYALMAAVALSMGIERRGPQSTCADMKGGEARQRRKKHM